MRGTEEVVRGNLKDGGWKEGMGEGNKEKKERKRQEMEQKIVGERKGN